MIRIWHFWDHGLDRIGTFGEEVKKRVKKCTFLEIVVWTPIRSFSRFWSVLPTKPHLSLY